MALTQSQVSALYVAIFGRASEGEANKKWQKSASLVDVAKEMLKSDEAKKLFGTSLDSDKAFIDFIYANVLGKGAGIDQAGKDFWVNKLKAGSDKAAIMSDIIHAAMDTKYASSSDTATKNAFNLFVNKVALSNIVSETVEKLPEGGVKALQEINKAVKPATKVAEVKNLITANEALKSAVDTTKLEKAATANDPAKVIANVTGAKAEEITKILKENPVVSTDDSGSSSQGSSDTSSSNNPGDSGSTGSGSGGSETPTVTIAQADLANTVATNLKIADSAANIQGALADLVTHAAKVASIKVSDNHQLTIADKDQFTALEEKLSVADKIEITGLGTDDIAIATSPKVDSFTMNGGARLKATVDQVKAITPKAPNNSIEVVDSATKIAGDVQALTSGKISTIEITGAEALKLTVAQYSLIQPKLTVPSGVSVSIYDVSEDAPITASAGNDTFVIKSGANKAQIGSFTATDKVNLSKVFAAASFEDSVIEGSASHAIAEGKAYFVKKTDLTSAFDATSTSGVKNFGDLFGSGKLLKTDSLGNGNSALIVVQVANDTVQVYKIAGTASAIVNTDVIKVATITGTFHTDGLKNNFVLEAAGDAPAPVPGIDTPVEIPAQADGFYKLFGDSKPLVKLELGSDKLFMKLGKLYKGADADHATTEITAQLPIKEVKLGDSHYTFVAVKNTAYNTLESWDDATIIAGTVENDTLTKGGLTYKFNASHKVKEVKKDGADIAGVDIDSLSDVLAGKFAANGIASGIAFAVPGINDYAFTTENLAKMATLVGAGNNPFADNVIAKVADGATITAENFKKLDGKIAAAVTTLKATDLAAGDKTVAKSAKVASFAMKDDAKLTVAAADVEALKTKAGAATDVFAVADTAASIKTALDNLVTNAAKVASINASDDGSEIEMTKAQFDALKDKLDASDKIKVTGLAAGDVAIAENAKVDSFTMNGGDQLAVTVAQAETIKAKAGNDSLAVKDIEASTLDNTALGKLADASLKDKIAKIDTNDNTAITLSVGQFNALGAKFETDEKLTINEATGPLAATGATDTFKVKADATTLAITGFAHDTDKVNVKAIAGVATGFEAAVSTTANKTVEAGKAYYVDGSAILSDSFNATTPGDTGFGKLFAATGKAFKTTVTGATTALLAVKVDADTVQLYKINSNGDGTATDISATDLTLVGSVTGADIDNSDFLIA